MRTLMIAVTLLACSSTALAAGKDIKGFGLYHWGMTLDEVLNANHKEPAHRADGKLGKLHVLAATSAQMLPKRDPLGQQFLFADDGKLVGIGFFHKEEGAAADIKECEELQKHFEGVWGAPSRTIHTSDNVKWDLEWDLGESVGALHCSQVGAKRLMNVQLRKKGFGE
ncbi:MAG: hypothetical protein JST54_04770 [Deltaproteobacteria bacterium]|nr:hypothetical protein [Deltaproteobacteria bacterium]